MHYLVWRLIALVRPTNYMKKNYACIYDFILSIKHRQSPCFGTLRPRPDSPAFPFFFVPLSYLSPLLRLLSPILRFSSLHRVHLTFVRCRSSWASTSSSISSPSCRRACLEPRRCARRCCCDTTAVHTILQLRRSTLPLLFKAIVGFFTTPLLDIGSSRRKYLSREAGVLVVYFSTLVSLPQACKYTDARLTSLC